MKKYFKVVAKCGHVGRIYYYRGEFFVCAENRKEAAKTVRYLPRVKHHHKDAILDVKEISKEEYRINKENKKTEAYFCCKNIQEQKLHWDEIKSNVFFEERFSESDYSDRKKENSRRKYKKIRFDWRKVVCEELDIAKFEIVWR